MPDHLGNIYFDCVFSGGGGGGLVTSLWSCSTQNEALLDADLDLHNYLSEAQTMQE